MATGTHEHDLFLQDIQKEFADILTQSSQGVYIYVDDPHWICNNRMAALLGYATPGELTSLSGKSPLLDAIVAPESRNRVVEAYGNAVEKKIATTIPVTWKKKGGATLKSETTFVPISFQGTILAIHFIAPS